MLDRTSGETHVRVTFRVDGQILEFTGHGAYTTEQIAAAVQAAKEHPEYPSPVRLLIDIRDSQMDRSVEDVRARLALAEKHLDPVRIAFVAAGETRERLVRMYRTRIADTTRVPIAIFSDVAAARAWLTASAW